MYILLYVMYKDMYVHSIHVYPTKMELKQRSPKPRNLGISLLCSSIFHEFWGMAIHVHIGYFGVKKRVPGFGTIWKALS